MKEYITTSLILQVSPLSESDVIIDLLTIDLGRVSVISQGVRLLKSRLRYALEPYSLIEASIIDSRVGWRLINARLISNLFYESNLNNTEVIVRFVNLLTRVLPPDEAELWHQEIIEFLVNSPDSAREVTLAVAYVLYKLGYLDLEQDIMGGIRDFDHLLVSDINLKILNPRIIQAINSSHL